MCLFLSMPQFTSLYSILDLFFKYLLSKSPPIDLFARTVTSKVLSRVPGIIFFLTSQTPRMFQLHKVVPDLLPALLVTTFDYSLLSLKNRVQYVTINLTNINQTSGMSFINMSLSTCLIVMTQDLYQWSNSFLKTLKL